MLGSRKLGQRVPTLTTFLVDEGIEDPNTTKSGPSSAHQQNAILMAFRWQANDGPTLNAGFVALGLSRGSGPVFLRNPIAVIFQVGPNPWLSSGSAHECIYISTSQLFKRVYQYTV